MKKPSFPVSAVWVLFHGGLVLFLGAAFLLGLRPNIAADLQSLIPSAASAGFREADRAFSRRSGAGVIIMAEADTFDSARAAAAALYGRLKDSAAFAELSLYAGDLAGEITAYAGSYRYQLLDRETVTLLETGKAAAVANEALARAYGAFSFSPLDDLDRDPFLLSGRVLAGFVSAAAAGSGRLSLREGVLSADDEGKCYVVIRGRLSESGAALTKRQSAVRVIYDAARTVDTGAARFLFSGVPFHSYESSSLAQRETGVISTVTVLVILVMFLFVFRSFLPVLMILFAAAASVFAGTASVLLFFRGINILTFVFGVSLIGICVDYSVHFFMRRRGGLSGGAVRARIARGVSLSFISSLIAFCALFFTPFTILKEFALFSAAGLFSSYLSALFLFPALPPPADKRGYETAFHFPRTLSGAVREKKFRAAAAAALVLVPVLLLALNRHNLAIQNSIRGLYTMPPALLESEKTAARLFNYSSIPSYVIIRGDSEEQVLEREEAFRAACRGELLGVSRFVPSRKSQERAYRASRALIPFAEIQFMSLGFSPRRAALFRDDLAANGNRYVTRETAPDAIRQLCANLWIGAPEGAAEPALYTCLMPLSPNAGDRAALEAAAEKFEWAAVIDKTGGIDRELDSLTAAMLRLLAAAYAVILAAVACYYRFVKKAPLAGALKIAAVPLVLAGASLGILSCFGAALSFFSVVGIMLAFGLGLDYIFYLTEDTSPAESRSSASGAVILSYLTTALSFGALLASSFPPVRIFALAVFPGLSAAFCAAMLLKETPADAAER
ncbi:MAG: MMPL family transporter [Treponema sp.]|jgi:predicted exporter|nr:MMPL family transporter [Treponema sp.]